MSLDTTDRILRIKTVLQMTGLSRSTLYRKVQRGEFPKQIKLSERCAGWRSKMQPRSWACIRPQNTTFPTTGCVRN